MALRQATTAIGNSTSPSATFASATVSGNLLIGLMAMQANRVLSASPSGWSARRTQQNTSGSAVTAELADKTSDGTETSVTWTATAGTGWSVAIEEHDDAVSGYDTSASNASNIATAVTSQPSGTATNTAADALVIAAFVAQNGNNTDGGRSLTNSFTETTMAGGGGGTARPMALLARKVVSASASQSCTFSTTDVGDEMWGALSIYSITGGGGNVTEITVTDGVYFYDGPPERVLDATSRDALSLSDAALHDLSRMTHDALFVSDERLLDLSRVITDDLFLDDQYHSILDRVVFDALLLASIYAAEITSGGVTEIAVLDALLLASTYARDNEAQYADSLLMSDAAFREAFKELSDNLLLTDNATCIAELSSTDTLLLNSLVSRAAELLVQEALLLGDDVTAQRINAAAALLTYARLAKRDPLGVALVVRDYLGIRLDALDISGIVTGVNNWRTE